MTNGTNLQQEENAARNRAEKAVERLSVLSAEVVEIIDAMLAKNAALRDRVNTLSQLLEGERKANKELTRELNARRQSGGKDGKL